MKKFHILDDIRRQRCIEFIRSLPLGAFVQIRESIGRTLEQNAKLWPMLEDISTQVDYFGQDLKPEDWKDIFTASLKGEMKVVPTLDNSRMVVLGLSTSNMTKRLFSDLIELMYAYGAANGVEWSEPDRVEELNREAVDYRKRREARENAA